jgi:hypothetical protein
MYKGSMGYSTCGRKLKKSKVKGKTYPKFKPKAFVAMDTNESVYPRDTSKQYKSILPALSKDPTVNAAPEKKVYTGTLVVGVSCLHKSNAVPVINQQEILDIARMRR